MVGCLIAVACMIVVSLSAGNVQSDMVPGDLGPVAAKLGIQQENGYYDLAKILGAILENLPTQSVAPVDWAGASRVVRTAADVTLSFRTVPGAACRLYVLYEGTGDCKRIGAGEGWCVAGADGLVSWTWKTEAGKQPATAVVRVSADSADTWHSFAFSFTDTD